VRRIDCGEDIARVAAHLLAERGEAGTVARAAQQWAAHFPLQLADLVAERRLGDVAFLRRAREAARAGDGIEVAQLVKLHRCYLS
jgi:hypothetical protein